MVSVVSVRFEIEVLTEGRLLFLVSFAFFFHVSE